MKDRLHKRSGRGSSCRRSERGATATEYGLLVGFIAMAILFGVGAFGTALLDVYNGLVASLAAAL